MKKIENSPYYPWGEVGKENNGWMDGCVLQCIKAIKNAPLVLYKDISVIMRPFVIKSGLLLAHLRCETQLN